MAQAYAALSNGVDSVVFHDSAAGSTWYKIQDDWFPEIANLNTSGFGPKYNDVVEKIPVAIGGSNAAHMYANAATLKRLMDNAESWWYNEAASATVFKYSPRYATVSASASPMQATVLRGGDLQLAKGYNVAASGTWMTGAQLTMPRIGEWLGNTESANSGVVTDGSLMTVVLTARNYPGPVELTLTNWPWANVPNFGPGYLAITDIANGIEIVDAEGLSGGAYTSVSGSAQLARSNNVLRYTPTLTTEVLSGLGSFAIIPAGVTLIAIFANVRNNSSSVSYLTRMRVYSNYAMGPISTQLVTIPPYVGTASPAWINLGIVARPIDFSGTWKYVLAVTASASGGTLDIDTLVFLNVQNPTTVIVGYDPSPTPAIGTLDINHKRLTAPAPSVYISSQSNAPVNYRGNPVYYSKGGSIYGVTMLSGGEVSADRWRMGGASPGEVAYGHTLTATRYLAYAIPE